MPAEPRRLALLLCVGCGAALAADAPAPAQQTLDPELLEFLGEFSTEQEWVDPIALDATQNTTLDRKERQAAAAARRAKAEQQAARKSATPEK